MTDASSSDDDERASESDVPTRDVDAAPSESDARLAHVDAGPSESDARLVHVHAAPSESDARLVHADAPPGVTDPSPYAAGPPLRATDSPLRATDPPAGASDTPAGDDGSRLAPMMPVHRVALREVRAFLARKETRDLLMRIVRAKVPRNDVEDLVQRALTEAMDTVEQSPPRREEALDAWLSTVARRVVADFLAKRGRRAKYEAPMPVQRDVDGEAPMPVQARDEDGEPFDVAGEPSGDPRTSEEDPDLEGRRIWAWLEQQVQHDPRDRETLAMMLEHSRTQKTYGQIAEEHGITLTALSQRIFVFKGKYVPRYRRWRERMLWLVLLLGGTALVAVAILVWWLLRPARIVPPEIEPLPPAPSATVTQEPFAPAQPPRSTPAPSPPAPDKPKP